jgi:hypothetical protein
MAAAGDSWSPMASLALIAFGLGFGGLGLGLAMDWHRDEFRVCRGMRAI